jgi:hypothetical protein
MRTSQWIAHVSATQRECPHCFSPRRKTTGSFTELQVAFTWKFLRVNSMEFVEAGVEIELIDADFSTTFARIFALANSYSRLLSNYLSEPGGVNLGVSWHSRIHFTLMLGMVEKLARF